jgi:hypothetical protein
MSGKRKEKRDDRVKLPLDPETALRALLAVKPADEPADDEERDETHQDRPQRPSPS